MLIVHFGPEENVGVNRIEASGDLAELLHDILLPIRAVHCQIGQADSMAAELFRKAVTETILEEEYWQAEVSGIGMAIIKEKEK